MVLFIFSVSPTQRPYGRTNIFTARLVKNICAEALEKSALCLLCFTFTVAILHFYSTLPQPGDSVAQLLVKQTCGKYWSDELLLHSDGLVSKVRYCVSLESLHLVSMRANSFC